MRGVGVRGRTVFNLELRHEREELRGGDDRGHGCRRSESPLDLCAVLGRREKRTLSFSREMFFCPKLEACSQMSLVARPAESSAVLRRLCRVGSCSDETFQRGGAVF